MRGFGRFLAILALAVSSMAASAHADLIAYWNFNNATDNGATGSLWTINPFGTPSAQTDYASDSGVGTAKFSVWGTGSAVGNLVGDNAEANAIGGVGANNNFGGFAGTTTNGQSGEVTGDALSPIGQGNNGHYFVISLNDAISAGMLSYATRGTSTGFSTQTWNYSTDGGATWSLLQVLSSNMTSTWSTDTISLDGIFASTSGNAVNLLRCALDGATSNSGNNRFDNVTITGTVVPEPCTLALLALGGVAAITRRRK